jgi:hypothetical protein
MSQAIKRIKRIEPFYSETLEQQKLGPIDPCEVGPMRIRKCSHVGGHKYAGNVLVYGKDQWHWRLDEIDRG